jgi:excisionase family DNA binding protein
MTTQKISPSTPTLSHSPASPLSRLAYGIGQAADAIGLSRSRIYELIAAGEIVVCKVGKRTIIPATVLTAFLERHRVERLPALATNDSTPIGVSDDEDGGRQ